MEAPKHPVGPPPAEETLSEQKRNELITQIEAAPALLRRAVAGMTEDQLGAIYKNWTIRQIANHLVDSHVNSYVRFKWALTEDAPVIKTYDENLWNGLADAQKGDLEPVLALFDGLHRRWVVLLKSMTPEQFGRTFKRLDGSQWTLDRALCIYAWHGRHHTGQIVWLRENRLGK